MSGDHQQTLTGGELPRPLVVQLLTSDGKPLSRRRVRFSSPDEGVVLDVDPTRVGLQHVGRTGTDGRVSLRRVQLGPRPGTYRVLARHEGPAGPVSTARFTVSADPRFVSVHYEKTPVREVIRGLADISGWNLQLSGVPEQPITVRLRDVTALGALDTVLESAGLTRMVRGNVLRVLPRSRAASGGGEVVSPDELKNREGEGWVTVTHRLEHLRAPTLAKSLRESVLGEQHGLLAVPSSNLVVVTAPVRIQRRLRSILERIDRPGETLSLRVIPLRFRSATRMADDLNKLLSPQSGGIVASQTTNSLLVRGTEDLLRQVRSLTRRMDRKGSLPANFTTLRLEGQNVRRIAGRVNTILGLSPVPLEELVASEMEVEDPDRIVDAVRSGGEIDVGSLVSTARVVPLPELEQILVFGPRPLREIVANLVERLRRKNNRFLRDHHWRWVRFPGLSLPQATRLINRIGGITVHARLREARAFLVSSGDPETLRQLRRLRDKIRRGPAVNADQEIVVYSPQFVQPRQLGEDLRSYFSRVSSDRTREDEPSPRVLHAGEKRIVLVVRAARARFVNELIERLDQDFYEDQTVITYSPQYISVQQLTQRLEQIHVGSILYSDSNRISVLVPGSRTARFRQFLEQVDAPGRVTRVVHLRHARLTELLESLKGVQEELALNVRFSGNPATNSLIYTAPRRSIPRVQKLVSRLDRWRKQVFIEGVILEYTLSENQEFQPRWFLQPRGNQVEDADAVPPGEGGLQLGNLNVFGENALPGTFTALLNERDFQAVLSLLASQSESEVLAKPQITAINNEQASIRVGDERQVEVSRQTAEGVVSSLQAVEAFTELRVTPTITADRYVRMDLLISSDQFSEPTGDVVTETTRRITENSVLVRGGQTVVIGGLIEETTRDGEQGIPLLKELPVLGRLFRSTSSTAAKRELVVFLTPRVIGSGREAKANADRVREAVRKLTPFPINVNTAPPRTLYRIRELSANPEDRQTRRRIADRILRYRRRLGPFRSLEELGRIEGISPDRLGELSHRLNYRVDVSTVGWRAMSRLKNVPPEAARELVEQRRRNGGSITPGETHRILTRHGVDPPFYRRRLRPVLRFPGRAPDSNPDGRPRLRETPPP